tara:strand:- start:1242 stop:2498 length:1257 start_codon:yes stop_codon:yes gene_type:complete
MVEGQDVESSNSKFGNFLDSIDRLSKKIGDSINGKNDDFNVNDPPIDIVEKPQINESKVKSPNKEEGIIQEKTPELIDFLQRFGAKTSSSFKSVFYNLQYIIPAIIIFQSSLWVAYLSNDSISNGFISTFVDSFGDIGQNILRLFSSLGWIIASTVTSSIDSQDSFGTFSMNSNVADLVFISLFISSILYLMKKIQSLYVLTLVFILSFILRVLEVDDFSYDWIMFSLVFLSSIIFTVLLSLPLSRFKRIKKIQDSTIDISVISNKLKSAEASYHTPVPATLGRIMDQAPVTKPRRPSRRSEYELYEWVLLLANLILWPAVFMISIILGSGVEVYGNSYNMDENYLMLIGPLFLTLFFFGILFKMDKNARDGSLYAAEKQSYLEEMEKYLKARTAYLELVTLQAESKKQEIVEGGSEE